MKGTGRTFVCFAPQMPFLIGCTLGIALSLIIMPLVEEHCLWYSKELIPTQKSNENSMSSYTENFDEYEPILNLNGKPKKSIQRQEKVQISRPRYYSTELDIKEKLFVGILTTPNTILTLGYALNRTLVKHANKVIFFLEGTEPENINIASTSVVGFSDERQVLLPFNMLQYISENYLNDYDFFFFAKDTTHIRGMKLQDFVNHISISQSVHVGQQMNIDSLYCSLDAGILLSNNIVKKTVEGLDWCIQHTFSESSSDNFGRCVLHGTRQSCASDVQGLHFVSHQVLKFDSLETSVQKSSWPKDLKNAITVYSISNLEDHYLIHHYFCQQELLDNHHSLLEFQEKIINISHMLPSNSNKVTWPIGIEPPFKPRSRFDVIQWMYFNESHSFLPNEVEGLSELKGLQKMEIQDIMKSATNWIRNKYNEKYIFQKLINGYKRFDPTRGTEYVLDLVFLEDATGKEILKRIEGVRPLNEVEIVPVPFVTEHTRIILLLIVKTTEQNGATHFLEDYAKSCLEKQDNTVLLLVLLYGPQDPGKGDKEDIFGAVKNLINSLTTKYRSTGAKIAWLSVRTMGKVPPVFSIIDLVARKLAAESMILLCRVGMEIHADYLNRIRMNTIIKTQVFFPIPFVQYHPALANKHLTLPDGVDVKKDLGHFDYHSFAHASFYLSDYLSARKLLENKIPAIRTDKDLKNELLYNSNFDIYDMFLTTKLHVMRTVEPDLRIRFSITLCDPESSAVVYRECLQNRENKFGTKAQLAAAVLSQNGLERSNNLELNIDL